MSYIPALRTYTFKSATAAQTFLPFFTNAARSLKQHHNVIMTSVFQSKTNPARVIAMVRYPVNSQPGDIIKSYLTSEAFAKDTMGMDMKANVERVEEEILEVVEVVSDAQANADPA
ncbi:hypothetical protein AC579_4727 [Pseudocercospora musae]|uniref:Uncharacterized protein n=1 Tax=Pseudocercospora musae TaxID=113226 RepID=A0A139IQ20_9PEZI|nr:hypothetical protein AC579_4727 [Pseudocercospora musae]